jgi:hypothetical protein
MRIVAAQQQLALVEFEQRGHARRNVVLEGVKVGVQILPRLQEAVTVVIVDAETQAQILVDRRVEDAGDLGVVVIAISGIDRAGEFGQIRAVGDDIDRARRGVAAIEGALGPRSTSTRLMSKKLTSCACWRAM